jgi:hypothetical protein
MPAEEIDGQSLQVSDPDDYRSVAYWGRLQEQETGSTEELDQAA